MWLSKERREAAIGEAAAESGPVTVMGPETAVYLSGERRNVAVCAPGGYAWCPQIGEEVLVLKAGTEQERPYVLGRNCAEFAAELAPGEVRLGKPEASILCGQAVELNGPVKVNGETLEELILRLAATVAG